MLLHIFQVERENFERELFRRWGPVMMIRSVEKSWREVK